MSEAFVEIGFFQLENLVLNRVPFCFIDLRTKPVEPSSQKLAACLALSRPSSPKEVEALLASQLSDKQQPVILLCEKAKVSKKVAKSLAKAGYLNIYLIEGGYRALEAEAASS